MLTYEEPGAQEPSRNKAGGVVRMTGEVLRGGNGRMKTYCLIFKDSGYLGTLEAMEENARKNTDKGATKTRRDSERAAPAAKWTEN